MTQTSLILLHLMIVATYVGATFPIVEKFEKWLTKFEINIEQYKKIYEKSFDDIFISWVYNDRFIEIENSKNLSYKLGHNKFSGLNSNEFSKFGGFFKSLEKSNQLRKIDVSQKLTFPESLDWEEKGAVTPVKDQGQCGSCWSFSTTGALEGAYYNKYGTLESFSEQQLVSCDNFKNKNNRGTDHGCNGGMMDNAFRWIGENDGLCTESNYPYTSGITKTNEECYKSCVVVKTSDIKTYVDVTPNSDNALMSALMIGPVSVAIQADQQKFQLYKSGVLSASDCGNDIDHGVLAVGWGTLNEKKYYKVKNSWGPSWGNEGYIYLEKEVEKNINNGTGTCGILSTPSYPLL